MENEQLSVLGFLDRIGNNMISVIDNFFPETLYSSINEYAIRAFYSGEHIFKTNYSWNENVVLDSAPVLIHAADGKVAEDIRETVFQKTGVTNIKDIMFYYWTRNSFIPWHDDAHKKSAITIYLNDTWDPNWGGYFLYEQNKDIKCIIPQRNKAIHNDAHLRHCTTPVTHNGFVRSTIQLFEDY